MRARTFVAVALVVVSGCGGDATTTTSTAETTPTPTETSAPSAPTSPTTEVPTTAATADLEIAVSVIGETVVVTVEGIPASGRIEIATGTAVRLTVAADIADEVHLHGYDVTDDVTPETPAVLEFTADIPGIFEVEFEDSHRLLVELQVS
jgi:glucose/arabinose dehydrogenase